MSKNNFIKIMYLFFSTILLFFLFFTHSEAVYRDSSAKKIEKYSQDGILIKFKDFAKKSNKLSYEADNLLSANNLVNDKFYKKIGIHRLKLKNKKSIDELISKLNKSPLVEFAEPDYIVQIQRLPNDPNFNFLWGMNAIDAPSAWDATIGDSTIVVAVIDTGVDYNHVDLNANMWRNPGEIPSNGLDDDNNGIIDDVYGCNTIRRTGNPMDDNKHGTHVAGTIGAVGNNGIGITGVNWNVKIMALKFIGADGTGSTGDAIECIDYVIDMKQRGVNVKITSNSWGAYAFSQSLYSAVERLKDNGILFVAAAGNNMADAEVYPLYPACFDLLNIISVSATDWNDNLSDFSNYGLLSVDLGAPGDGIYSTILSNKYDDLSGTSMAAPHVAGAAALIWGYRPLLNYKELRRVILAGTDPLTSLSGKVATGGRLNVNNGLTIPVPPNQLPIAKAECFIPEVMIKESVSFNGSLSSDIDGNIISYSWNFGDGKIGDGKNVTHEYNIYGIYTVTLTVTDDEGATAIDSVEVKIINYTVTPDSGKSNSLITITKTGDNFDSSYKIYIGNGGLRKINDLDTPGFTFGVYVSGNYAYVADGISGLQIIDISDPNNLNIVGSVDTPGIADKVCVSGNYAYIADGDSGLQIIDISNPVNPNITGNIDTPGYASGINISGNYAYIADGFGSGLQIIDISNPFNPNIVGSVVTPNNATSVYITGNYAYVADGYAGGLQIINIGDPFNPIIVGSVSSLDYAQEIYVSDNYAYLADGNSGLKIIDISNKSNPVIVKTQRIFNISGLYKFDNYLYAVGGYGLQVIDISDPLNAKTVDTVNNGYSTGVFVTSNYIYIAGSYGFEVIGLNNSFNPGIIGSINVSSYANNIYLSNNYAYITDNTGLQIINISDPVNPVKAGNINTQGYAYGVFVSDNYAYIAEGDIGLQIIDISNPSNPSITGSIDTPGYAYGVYVTGNYAYVADGYGGGLKIINISDPANPVIVSNVVTPHLAKGVYVSGNYAYVADGTSGLQIINISDPANPNIIGSLDTPGYAEGVYVSGNYAYVADSYEGGLQIIDISNPASPNIIGSSDTPGGATGVFVSGNYAYVTDGYEQGLQVINISDPFNPVVINCINNTITNGVYVSGNNLYVLTDSNLFIIDKISAGTSLTPVNIVNNNTISTVIPNGLIPGIYNINIVHLSMKNILYNAFTVMAGTINRPPVLTPIENKTVNEVQLLQFIVTGSDPDTDALIFAAEGLPGGAVFDTTIKTFTWTPDYTQAGDYNVTFTVSDGFLSDSQIITITVNNVNRAPELYPIENKTINEGVLLQFNVSADDPDGDVLTFTAVGLPRGAIFDTTTKIFTWAPDYTQSGNYNVAFTVSDGSLPVSETITITVQDVPKPDLIMTVLSTTSTKVAPGSTLSVSNTAKNQGGAASGAFTIAFHLSQDTIYGGSDDVVLAAVRIVSSLGAGVTSASSTTLTIPASTPLGNYYICAFVDKDGVISEMNEQNNTMSTAIPIEVAGADLVMTSVSSPLTGLTGTSISISSTVQNQGTGTISSFYNGIYLSTDGVITTSDTRIGIQYISSLNGASSSTLTSSLVIPSTLTAGRYYIGAIADYNTTRVETNENNNTLTGNTIDLTSGVDAIMTLISGPATGVTGTSVSITSTAKNQGIGTMSVFLPVNIISGR
ncbi:S8 family serine peptidase [Candidatus Desantisbacteria bacterium]|nr:S8 family serine peptidase [Candidatus Desantisbacteria bacterium]